MLKKEKDWALNFFNFKLPFPMVVMKAIGRHKITDEDYYWDNNNREKDGNYCLLQYTISGYGEIISNGKKYKIKKNQAFLVTVPGNEVYYLPKNTHWEVLYVELSIEALPFVEYILKNNNNSIILDIPENSKFLSLFWSIFYSSINNEINNIFDCSHYTYNLIFELLNLFEPVKQKKDSEVIGNIKKFIKKNYHKPISMEDISKHVALSKFHLTRKFKEEVGISPGQYLIKVRLTKSTDLLLNSNLTVEEISEKVGFSCGNYFSKAFKHKFNTSPTQYRNYYKHYYKVRFSE